MKKTVKIVLGLTVLTGIGILVVRELNRRRDSRRELRRVADNGYETAHDVLYPGKKGKDKKLHYGPVLPR